VAQHPDPDQEDPSVTIPSFSLDDRAALVTGAASGIGRRLALGLAEAGADVGCVDLPSSDLAGTVAEIEATGRRALALPADVTREGDLDDAVGAVEQRLGPLRAAINCAGIGSQAAAEDMPLAEWQKVLDVNLTGVFLSSRAEGRAMLATGGGAIVNIASMSASIVNRGRLQAHYNASKAAVVHLSKTLAVEWATRGVRVNCVSPGYTATPMIMAPEMEEDRMQFAADTPMGRMATVDDLVGPAIFLLSDASSFCTGVDLIVDGGFVCW
jgi:NAD(P)-dependent dehydrogenase (short-subunit alcohol dehydrogenase family)